MRIIGEAINTGERGTDSRMFPLQKLLCELGASLPGVLYMCISLVSISKKKMTVRSSEHAADNVNNQKKNQSEIKARQNMYYLHKVHSNFELSFRYFPRQDLLAPTLLMLSLKDWIHISNAILFIFSWPNSSFEDLIMNASLSDVYRSH